MLSKTLELKDFVTRSPIANCVIDQVGQILCQNKLFEQLVEKTDIENQNFFRFLSHSLNKDFFWQLLETKSLSDYRVIIKTDQNIKPVELSANKISSNGTHVAIVYLVQQKYDQEVDTDYLLSLRYPTLLTSAADISAPVMLAGDMLSILGYTGTEVVQQKIELNDLILLEDRQVRKDALHRLEQNSPQTCTYRIKHKSGDIHLVRESIIRREDNHPDRYYESIIWDITHAFSEKEPLYYRLLKDLRDKVFVIDVNGICRFANNSILKCIKKKLIGEHFRTILDEELANIIGNKLNDLKAGKRVPSFVIHYNGRLGMEWYQIQLTPLHHRDKFAGMMGLAYDITEQKKHKKAIDKLESSENKYQYLMETSPDATFVVNKQGYIVMANRKACSIFGYKEMHVMVEERKTPYDYVVPTERDRAKKLARESLRAGKTFRQEFIMRKANGHRFPGEVIASAIQDSHGTIISYIGTVRDMTERKRSEMILERHRFELEKRVQERTEELAKLNKSLMEEIEERKRVEFALRESEEKYRTLVESAGETIATIDEDGYFTFVNSVAAHRLKVSGKPEDFIGRNMFDLFPREIAQMQQNVIKRVIQNNKGETTESETVLQGVSFWYRTNIEPLRTQIGNKPSVLLVATDITERKKQQEELKKHRNNLEELVSNRTMELEEAKEKYQLLIDNMTDMVIKVDKELNFMYANPTFCETFEIHEKEIIGTQFWPVVHKKDREKSLKLLSSTYRLPYRSYLEQRVMTQRGWRWMAWASKAIVTEEEDVQAIVSVGRDITTQKEAEEKLRASEARFRDVIDRSIDGYFFIDINGFLGKYNRSLSQMFEMSLEQNEKVSYEKILTLESRQEGRRLFNKILSGDQIPWYEIKCRTCGGKEFWIGLNARRVIENGIVIGIEGFVKDITESKHAFQALQESEAHYRALFANIPYEIFELDQQGYFSDANEAFVGIWGDVIGKRPDDVIQDKEMCELIKSSLHQAIKERRMISKIYTLTLDNKTIIYSMNLRPVLTRENIALGVVGLNIDVTDIEMALERARELANRLVEVQEEERARISREVHDSLGQYFTALDFGIKAARNGIESDPDRTDKVLIDAQKTIKEAMSVVQEICHRLRPPLLDDFGLVAAMKDYLSDFASKWGIRIHCRCKADETLFTKSLSTMLFRVTQESLTNILKHADATRVLLFLGIKDKTLHLLIRDNGKGFDTDILSIHSNEHFGLLGMQERVEMQGGEFRVQSWIGKGTRIYVSVQLDRRLEKEQLRQKNRVAI